jgi:hypothetical protein
MDWITISCGFASVLLLALYFCLIDPKGESSTVGRPTSLILTFASLLLEVIAIRHMATTRQYLVYRQLFYAAGAWGIIAFIVFSVNLETWIRRGHNLDNIIG